MTKNTRTTHVRSTAAKVAAKVVLTDDLKNLRRQVRRLEAALDEAAVWMTFDEDSLPSSSTISMDEVNHLV